MFSHQWSVCGANRFLTGKNEKAAFFTGATQRAGTYILPFVMPAIFALGRLRRQPARPSLPSSGAAAQASPRARSGGRRQSGSVASRKRGAPPVNTTAECAEILDSAGEEEDPVPLGTTFNWAAYRAAFGETPYEDAVTHMFAEYAVLYGRIAGWVTSATPVPMTLDEGKSISEQAAAFVTDFMTPILGPAHTPKVHKLLRHVLDAIRMHGNLRNGNTDKNESYHKDDKQFYQRTNKAVATFTQQLVRQAQGSRAVVRRIDSLAAMRRHRAGRGRRSRSTLSGATAVGQAARPVRHLLKISVASLARRPGLQRLGQLLQMSDARKVPVLTFVKFIATLDCDTAVEQTLWSTPSYRGAPWFDAVLYSLDADQGGGTAASDSGEVLHVGDVRALIRCAEGDVAVVCEMEPVPPEPGCPLFQRGCTRLKWATPPLGTDWALRAVPLRSVRRVVHVVPDFKDLSARRGLRALPPGYRGPFREHRDMRFFVNDFTPALSRSLG